VFVSDVVVTAAGCADVTPPRHTWMRRNGDQVEVGCPTTKERWTLTCVDGRWDGKLDDRDSCPGVPGVRLPGDIDTEQSSNNEDDDSDSFWSSFPVSKSTRVFTDERNN